MTGQQDQLRSSLIGPPSCFAGLIYYLFVFCLEDQPQQKSTGLAKKSLVEDQRIGG